MNEIKNIIINNSIKEFDSHKDEFTEQMNYLVRSVIVFGGLPTLIDKINEENGTVYIKSNPDFSAGSVELINVSAELKSEYESKRP